MYNHKKSIATLNIMLSEIRFNLKRHGSMRWQQKKRDKLEVIYDDEIEAIEYALGVLTGKICFIGRTGAE